jgi:exopolysaccharide production protein ExoQ
MIADRFGPIMGSRAVTAQPNPFNRAVTQVEPIQVTPAVVGFYLSFRVVFVLIAARLFLEEPRMGAAASLVCNFALLLGVAFESFGAAVQNEGQLLRLRPFRWVLLFLGFSGCSLLWSIAASLASAVVYWCAMAADLGMVVLLLRTNPVLDVGCALMKGYVWGACAVAFSAWIIPAQSDLRLGDEELLGPNQIGYVCAFAMFLAQFLIRRKQYFWIVPSIFLGITLLRTISKTTILAFVAGQAFILLRDRSLSLKGKLTMIGAAVCILAFFWSLIGAYYIVYTNAGNQAETLTGRLGIWVYFLEQSVDKLWIGHGFHSVWKVVPLFGEDFEARHAHNELIQQFYAYGVAGIVMLIGLYGSLWRQIRALAPSSLKAFAGGLLLFILVRGLADTEPFDLSLPLWAITLLSAILMNSSLPKDEDPVEFRPRTTGAPRLRSAAL